MKLTRRDGWTKLGRILAHQGRKWQGPQGDEEANLCRPELHAWLREAGCEPTDQGRGIPDDQQLTLAEFAQILYAALVEAPRQEPGSRS